MNLGPDFFILALFVGMFGLCIGSFLNVVILRAFSNESIVLPPSKCPSCNAKLKPYDNIPVLSYLILRGKCRNCKCHISIQYPLVELTTAVGFISAFAVFGPTVKFLFTCIFLSLFIVLAVTDIKEQVIFDWHAFILAGVGLFYNLFSLPAFTHIQILNPGILPAWMGIPVVNAILGMVLGVVLMELMARLSIVMIGQRGFGEGDSYIAGALGAIFGWQGVVLIIVMSFVLQSVMVFPVFIKKLWKNKDYTQIYAIALFVASVLLFKACDWLKLMDNFWVFAAALLQMIVIGLYACKKVLDGAKHDVANLISAPFGPALVLASVILIFWGAF